MSPREFWETTPAEYADLALAYRLRRNHLLMTRAWELSHLLSPHVEQKNRSHIAPMTLFEAMPGTYPDDLPVEVRLAASSQRQLTPEQKRERRRRENVPRLQRPQ
jgi:hypothetical protein